MNITSSPARNLITDNNNDHPELFFINLNTKINIKAGSIFRILWSGTALEESVGVSIYRHSSKTDTTTCNSGANVAYNITDNRFANFDTTYVQVGTYYICAVVEGDNYPAQDFWTKGEIEISLVDAVNDPPVITSVSPASDVLIEQGSSYQISWLAYDNYTPHSDVVVSLYYADFKGVDCSGATLIGTTNLASSTYIWNSPLNAPNYICMTANDGVNAPVDAWSSAKIYFNKKPTASISLFWQQAAGKHTAPRDLDWELKWTAKDADNANATAKLYMSQTITESCSGDLLEDTIQGSATKTRTINLASEFGSSYLSGVYYFCAEVDDGINPKVTVWSGAQTIYGRCLWTGASSTDWSNTSNWVQCNNLVPTHYMIE